jgi:hypothetical protein
MLTGIPFISWSRAISPAVHMASHLSLSAVELTALVITDEISANNMGLYLPIAAAFKSKAFQEENEWRLISHLIQFNHPHVAVRATSTMLIPYFELNLDLGVDPKGNRIIGLEHVIVGPAREKTNISKGVGFACSRYAVRNLGVTFSQAPYRTL